MKSAVSKKRLKGCACCHKVARTQCVVLEVDHMSGVQNEDLTKWQPCSSVLL